MDVLIVDDSPLVRQLLRYILESEGMSVREAGDGQEALDLLQRWRPDVVTMDIHMPRLDGYETTARIMQRHPLPVVVVTGSSNLAEARSAMLALDIGALAVLEKPRGPDHPQFAEDASNLLHALRLAAQARARPRAAPVPAAPPRWDRVPRLVAIGASAGGPIALKTLLAALEPGRPWPILVVQHIAPGFLDSYRDWLAGHTRLPVAIAAAGERAEPGRIYLAPDGYHLALEADLRLALQDAPLRHGQRPSVAVLFESVLQRAGADAVAILLSGMGKDGAEALALLKRRGALTLVQSADTALVNGMPGAALALDAASRVLAPEQMAGLLNTLKGPG